MKIVVLWGGDRTEALKPHSVDGTAVMHGGDIRRRVEDQPAVAADGVWRDEAWLALSRFIEKRERHDPTLTEVPRSLTDHLSRTGVTTASAAVIFLGLSWTFTATHSVLALVAATTATVCISVILRRRLVAPFVNGALIATAAVVLVIAAAMASLL